jgi:alkanesulfonate monooxygenase SsuD/methylene tetrahydromethanopterin reductase-like flavin-dependent oxidoreductase (luciferase family)
MKYGVSFLPDVGPNELPAADYYRQILELCLTAENLGLEFVKMTEHYLHQYGGYCPSPLGFLSAVAVQTTKIRLMTGCVLPVFHHPVQLASEAAQLDAISDGRAEIGFARAYLPYEFDCFGINLDGSRARFDSTVKTVVELWEGEGITSHTDYWGIENATTLPRPTQADGIPSLIAAVRTPESFQAIGAGGHGLLVTPGGLEAPSDLVRLYREAFVTRRRAVPQPRVVVSLPLLVTDDADDIAAADGALDRYLHAWSDAVSAWNNRASGDYPSYTGMARYLEMMSGTQLRLTGSAVVGTPDEVARQIVETDERFGGLDAILWQLDYGNLPAPLAHRSLELFANSVRPQLPKHLQ